MNKLLAAVAVIVITATTLMAQEKKSVKIGDTVLVIESVELKKGVEIVAKKDKDMARLAPFIPDLLGEKQDASALAYMEWFSLGGSYVVVKYTLTNKGENKPLYVSPAARYDPVMKSKTDDGKILTQTRMYPEARPECCVSPGVLRLEKDKETKDALVIRAPAANVKSAEVEIYVSAVFPETGGTLKLGLPFANGKPAAADKVTLEYKAPEKKEEERVKNRSKTKIERVQVEVADVISKNMSLLDKESDMVFTSSEETTVVSLKITNKGSKPIKYAPVLLQQKLPGIAVDNQGQYCPLMALGDKAKVVECFDLKDSIPPGGEITDFVAIDAPSGMKSLRLVLIANQVFPDLKKDAGILIFSVKYKKTRPCEIAGGLMKRSVTLNDKAHSSMLDEAGKLSDEAWDKKYTGLLVSGAGEVVDSIVAEEDNVTILFLKVSENALSGTSYGYVVVLSGCIATYQAGDKVAVKGIVLNNESKKDQNLVRNLVIYGLDHARTNR